jgi:general nucleoside transport system ATP-binding protein
MFEKRIAVLETGHKNFIDRSGPPLLELCGVCTRGEGAQTSLKDIDLKVHPGEIVGVAGVSGNGQKELGDLALGMIKCVRGKKFLFGRDSTNLSIRTMRRRGIGFIPENPSSMAIAPYMTVLQNMALTRTWKYARSGGFRMDWKAVKKDAENTMQALEFSFPLYVPARTLSGGNLQRMVIVRELTQDPRLIIASYLTRGLDVQSTLAARQALVQARAHGTGVLLISEDLEELFTLSDRLIVLYAGEVAGSFNPEETNIFEVGHLMTGSGVQNDKIS